MRMTRGELKLAARRCLQGKYGSCALLLLVFYLVTFVMQIPYQVINMLSSVFMATELKAVGIMFLIIMFVYYILMSLMSYGLSAGISRYFYRMISGETYQISDLFYFVTHGFTKVLRLNALYLLMTGGPIFVAAMLGLGSLGLYSADLISMGAVVVFYSICLVAASVITCMVYLNYGLVYYIYNENPDLKVMQVFKESARLMKGNKVRSFCLGLSFLGVNLLGLMSAGIGYIWVFPYICCTLAYFYMDIKAEKAAGYDPYL